MAEKQRTAVSSETVGERDSGTQMSGGAQSWRCPGVQPGPTVAHLMTTSSGWLACIIMVGAHFVCHLGWSAERETRLAVITARQLVGEMRSSEL